MFLQKVSRQLLTANTVLNVNTLRCLNIANIALGKNETEIIEKWKQKFAKENIDEIESSIKHILDHVINKKEVSECQ